MATRGTMFWSWHTERHLVWRLLIWTDPEVVNTGAYQWLHFRRVLWLNRNVKDFLKFTVGGAWREPVDNRVKAISKVSGLNFFGKTDCHLQTFYRLWHICNVKGVLKSKTVKSEIFLTVKELVLIDTYKPSIRFYVIITFCWCSLI